MPRPLSDKLPVAELLSYEELLRVVSIAVRMGVRKVRLTGGEPLVRRDITGFIHELAKIPGLEEVRITTNGTRLLETSESLYKSGVRKINISLDTMKPERFKAITGVDLFEKVWQGIEKILEQDGSLIKINVVALKGLNDDEFVDFVRLTIGHPLQVRFIEFMPVGPDSAWEKERYISVEEIKEKTKGLGPLVPVRSEQLDGPARIFKLPDSKGTIGFISPLSEHFCANCNRLRLTATGSLRSCLLTDQETDIKTIIRTGGDDRAIMEALLQSIKNKPKGHRLAKGPDCNCHGHMSRIGG